MFEFNPIKIMNKMSFKLSTTFQIKIKKNLTPT